MSAEIKKIAKIPKKALVEATGIGKEVLKPASTGGAKLVLIGAIASPLVATGYTWLYNMTVGKLPIPPVLNKIVQIGLPLVAIPFVRKTKLPAGNLINGTLLGISITQIIYLIMGMVGGKGIGTVKKDGIDAGLLQLDDLLGGLTKGD